MQKLWERTKQNKTKQNKAGMANIIFCIWEKAVKYSYANHVISSFHSRRTQGNVEPHPLKLLYQLSTTRNPNLDRADKGAFLIWTMTAGHLWNTGQDPDVWCYGNIGLSIYFEKKDGVTDAEPSW